MESVHKFSFKKTASIYHASTFIIENKSGDMVTIQGGDMVAIQLCNGKLLMGTVYDSELTDALTIKDEESDNPLTVYFQVIDSIAVIKKHLGQEKKYMSHYNITHSAKESDVTENLILHNP